MNLKLNSVRERLIFLSPTVQAGLEKEPCTKDFDFSSRLGQGGFGKVYRVRHTKTKKV